MRNFCVRILAVCLGLLMINVQADTGLTNNPNLLTLDNIAPTNTPKMTLLQGVVLVAKYINLDKVSPSNFSNGSSFILCQYVGPINLSYVNSPILIEDLSQVKTISNLSFFAAYDPKKTGLLSEDTIRKANLVLVYYNTNGFPVMRSMANYGVHQLAYDLTTNKVKLDLYDAHAHQVNLNLSPEQTQQAQAILNAPGMDKYLMAELVNFGSGTDTNTNTNTNVNANANANTSVNTKQSNVSASYTTHS